MNSFSDGYKKKFVVACTGASGVIYFLRLLRELCFRDCEIHVIISQSGKQVLAHETGYRNEPIKNFLLKEYKDINLKAQIFEHKPKDYFAPPASGSFFHNGMVIVPSTMKTLGSIASGVADSLILRSADVCLKERRKLIIVPRETPFNRIHLKNMLEINDAGGTIMPASPAFYHHPISLDMLADSVVARIMNHLGIPQDIVTPWGELPENLIS
jgi:4-hydroxy-3-polyprenylbenzoate decarboxylase